MHLARRVPRLAWMLVGSALLVAFLVLAVFPTRTWIDQRDQIAAEHAKVAVLDDQNRKLAARVQELHDDSEIERIAREQYSMVKPGEKAYAILPGPADPQPTPVPTEPPKPPKRSIWWKTWHALQLWN